MPDFRTSRFDHALQRNEAPGPAIPAHSSTEDLTADQIRRLAELIATGSTEFPDDLGPMDHERLLTETRRILRGRLIGLVARAIATDIRSASDEDKEVRHDA